MISVTITDRSGRTLSGQTLDAFYVSIAHARPFSVGINCALGARDMRPYLAELARIADVLRQLLSERRPAERVRRVRRAARRNRRAARASSPTSGFVNIVGGCCGTTPDHIARDRRRGRRRRRRGRIRDRATARPSLRVAATRSSPASSRSTIRPDSNFQMIGERTNVTGSKRVRAADQGRQLRRGGAASRSIRSAAAPTSSTSTWTKACSTPSRR